MDKFDDFRKTAKAKEIKAKMATARDGMKEILDDIKHRYGERPYAAANIYTQLSVHMDGLIVVVAMLMSKGAPPEEFADLLTAHIQKTVDGVMDSALELLALTQGPEGQVSNGLPNSDVGEFMGLLNAAAKRMEGATFALAQEI
jgi:hypothetical protein